MKNVHTKQSFQNNERLFESELKHRHGYDVASSSGLVGMELQGAMAIFTVNIKRILKMIKYSLFHPNARLSYVK